MFTPLTVPLATKRGHRGLVEKGKGAAMLNETLNDEALLRGSQLTNKAGKPGLLGISKASLYRLLAAGKFPEPVRPLPGVVAWRAGDVRAWLQSHKPEPAPSWASTTRKQS